MSSFRPKMDMDQLFMRGTDITLTSRFKETLAYNNFNLKDSANLLELQAKLIEVQPSAKDIFNRYLSEISPDGKNRYL